MKYILSAILGALALAGAQFFFITHIPMDTKAKALPFEKMLAHKALRASIGMHVDDSSPIPTDENNLVAGAKIYTKACATCHGELNRPPPPFALGEYPPPPQLLPPKKGVSDDPVGETFWKVKNGIRLTGMPGFSDSLSETEMWQVSLFLSKSDQLPPSVLDALKGATQN